MSDHPQPNSPGRLLKLKDVVERCALSRTSIYAKIKAGTFPRQMVISVKAVAWLETEIDDWIRANLAARDGQ